MANSPFYDGCLEYAHRSVRNVNRCRQQKDQPQMRVEQSFPKLCRLERLVLNTSGVTAKPRDSNGFFFDREMRLQRTVREENNDQNSNENCDQSEDQKHNLSGFSLSPVVERATNTCQLLKLLL